MAQIFNELKSHPAGKGIQLFPGVKEWFDRIRKYGDENGVVVEHYVISSGLKEMIDATAIARDGAFKKVYANSFYYNLKGVAEWPAQIVNYTNKTQFLFRISKGCLDINDPRINEYYPPEKIRVPFRNIVYIGDSDTDIPCMKLVNSNGGHSIGVFNPKTADKTKVYKMMHDKRIRYFVPADYSVDSELDVLLQSIIVKTSAQERLNRISQGHGMEAKKYNDSVEFEKNFKWIEGLSKARNLTIGELMLQLRDEKFMADTTQG